MTDTAPTELTAPVSLPALIAQLRSEPTYSTVGHAARSLVRTADLRVTLVVMRAGASLHEHRAKETVSVQVLEGSPVFTLSGGEQKLQAGDLYVLPPSLPHAVQASDDCAFLLSFGWK